MNIFVFNPWHDLALASGSAHYMAPHSARQLEADLSFLPALWAEDGDIVLVDDVEQAIRSYKKIRGKIIDLKGNLKQIGEPLFVTDEDLKAVLPNVDNITIKPWGWDMSLKHRLQSINVLLEPLLPDDNRLLVMRELSSRRFAANAILPKLVESNPLCVGESRFFNGSVDELFNGIKNDGGKFVLKAPWSCSGRGIRYVSAKELPNDHLYGWCQNLIKRQGGLMVEPYYNKVMDFGMEFYYKEDGVAEYRGLSLFKTINGAYEGNVIASEEEKQKILNRYVSSDLLNDIKERIFSAVNSHFSHVYSGPFGIDMMIVSGDKDNEFYVHPCVEINLRQTMGHVALKLSGDMTQPEALMRITYTDKFRFQITVDTKSLINTGIVK